MPNARLPLLTICVLAGLLAAASLLSSDDGDGEEATPTPATTATATAVVQDIRGVDFSQQPDVLAMLRRTGGEVVPADVLYADLTGDGREEAVVPIFSGGTAGNVAFVVVGFRDGELAALLSKVPEGGSVRVAVVNGQLVETQPLYEEGDQPGFPARVRNIYYAWDGDSLVVEREETVPSRHAPPKQ